MSKIERYQGNLRAFASNAQGLERTVFGGTGQANDLTSQVTAAFLRGWGIVGPSEHPSLEDFNAAMFAMSQFLAYQHQIGTPEWHAEQEYYTGSVCTHGGVSYQSLIDDNVGNEPPSAQWTPVLTAKSGGEAFQPRNEKLTAFSALAGASNRLPYFTGANALALTALTAVGRDLIGKSTAAEVLTYLGLGGAAKLDVGTTAGTVAAGDDSRFAPGLGVGQTWSSTPRVPDTTYTNSTGRPIFIVIYLRSLSNASAVEGVLTIGSVPISFGGGGVTTAGAYKPAMLSVVIPAGATYSLSSATAGAGIAGWYELR